MLHADRHADPHGREFARAHETTVPDGPLPDVLSAAAAKLPVDMRDGARLTVMIDEPHD